MLNSDESKVDLLCFILAWSTLTKITALKQESIDWNINSKGNWEYIIVYTYYLGFSVKDCME